MDSAETKPRKRKRTGLLALVIAALLLALAFFARTCLGIGLDTGDEESSEPPQPVQAAERVDAGAPPALEDAARPESCYIKLDSRGMTVDGKPASLEDAVRICSAVGLATLDVKGDTRTGTFNELVRALRDAGVAGVPDPQ